MDLNGLQTDHDQNLAIAAHFFERIAKMNPVSLPGLTVLKKPLKIFCSDIVLFASKWQADFCFSAETLRTLDIVPLLVNVVMQIQAPHKHQQRIYTVLTELCSNALEHGLLKLDSKLKQSANGFAEYYTLRGQRLAELSDNSIKVSLLHQANKEGGQLTIVVEDSGDGFDYQQHVKNLAENEGLCGRGEGLVKQLCSEFHYSGHGNIAHAVYSWIS